MNLWMIGIPLTVILVIILMIGLIQRLRRRMRVPGQPSPMRRGLLGKRYGIMLVLISAAFISVFIYIIHQEELRTVESFQKMELYDARRVAGNIERDIKVIQSQLNLLAHNSNIIQFDDSGKALLRTFYEFAEKPWVRAISRVSADAHLVYSEPIGSFAGADLSHQVHQQRMAKEHRALVSAPFTAIQGFDAIAVAEPIFHGDQFVGSIVVLLDFQEIATKHLYPITTGSISTASMINEEELILIHYRPNLHCVPVEKLAKEAPTLVELVHQMIEEGEGTGVYVSDWYRGNHTQRPLRRIVAFATVQLTPQNKWIVGITANEEDILAASPLLNWPNAILALLFFAMIIIVSMDRLRDAHRYTGKLEEAIESGVAHLRRSEGLFHQIFERSAVSFLLLDPEGNFIHANQALSDLFGIPLKRLAGYNMLQDQEWDRAGMKPAIRAVFAGREESLEAVYSVGSLGSFSDLPHKTVHIGGNLFPVFDDHGTIMNVLLVCSDISDRKQAQLSLQRINRALKTISSGTRTLVHARDEHELLRENCRIMTEVGGYRLAWIGLSGRSDPQSVWPVAYSGYDDGYLQTIYLDRPDQEWGTTPAKTAIQSGRICLVQDVMAFASGQAWRAEAIRRGFASTFAIPLFHGPTVIGVLCVYSSESNAFDEEEIRLLEELAGDLSFGIATLRTRAEHLQAEQSRMLLATAVGQAAEPIFITDTHGIIQYVNPAFCRLSGYSAEEAIGNTPRILKSNRHDPLFYHTFWDILSRGQVWTGHFINRRKDGALYEIESMISPVRNAEGGIEHYVAVSRDVTLELNLEAQLRQAQKMEAIGQLAGGIAHDFSNLLTGVMGNLDLIRRRMNPQIEKNVNEASQACNRATELIRQLLTFARKSPGAKVPLNLHAIVQEAALLAQKSFDKRIDLHLPGADQLPRVLADPGQIHQLVMNLCVNARDALGSILEQEESSAGQGNPERSYAVTVGLSEEEVNEDYCRRFSYAQPGRYVALSIADNGIGMDAATQARIFDPFFTTKELGKGTGLGLATVYGIVKNHQGWIQVTSSPGEGTSFKIYLPLADPQPPRASGSDAA